MDTDVGLEEQLQEVDTAYAVETRPAERFNRYRFVIRRGEEDIGYGTYFTGGRNIAPWIELQPATMFDPDSDADRAFFQAVTAVLGPGSHVMVHYLQDDETAEALTADVPPPATPLGYLLWQAGVRWYKDWYFTEGWMEGDQKLQGNIPVDDQHREEREQEWKEVLSEFVDRETAHRNCQKRVRALLETL